MRKTILILLLLGVCFADQILSNHLSITDILESTWEFYNDAGFLGYMTFNPDRTISTYEHNN